MIYFDAINMKEMGGLKYLKAICKFSKSNKNIKFIIRNSLLRQFVGFEKNRFLILNDKNIFSLIGSFVAIQLKIIRDRPNLVAMSGYTLFLCKNIILIYQNQIPFDMDVVKKYNFKVRIKFLLLRLFLEFNYLRASKIIFLTYGSLNQILSKIWIKRFSVEKETKVIYHGLDRRIKPIIKNEFDVSNDVIDIVYISSYQPYKKHDEIIDFFENISKFIRLRLHFFGGYILGADKYTNKLKKQIKNSKIVIDHGFQETKEIFLNVPKNSLFIFNSSCETFGQIVLEVGRSGFPILVSKQSNAIEIVPKNYDLIFDFKLSKENTLKFLNLVNQKEVVYKASNDFVKHSYNFDENKLINNLIKFTQ